jgi:hypothetical protein
MWLWIGWTRKKAFAPMHVQLLSMCTMDVAQRHAMPSERAQRDWEEENPRAKRGYASFSLTQHDAWFYIRSVFLPCLSPSFAGREEGKKGFKKR